ncbi:MAG: fatty acid kinase [Pseudonocardiales bacterium]|nr:fatty acid kinase [Pseudonocardiales bacterium]
MLVHLDASAVRRWCSMAAEDLEAHRGEIDDLNVFPIPDGDTGTNLALTLKSANEAVAGDRSAAVGAVLRVMARGALLGARGNSGVIVSQLLRGLADSLDGAVEADAAMIVAGLRRAADAAYAAVSRPVEGTILSVIKGAAEAAEATTDADLATVVQACVGGARESLRRTPDQLAVLARAGVVDAGGRGLVVLLEALATVVVGWSAPDGPPGPSRTAPRNRAALEAIREAGSDAFGYEVQYLLHTTEDGIESLKSVLQRLGDCVVVVGSGEATAGSVHDSAQTGLFNVHVHVNDVGAAIEAGIEVGRPHRITVTRFADQVAAEGDGRYREEGAGRYREGGDGRYREGTVLVAVAPGVGLADLFRSEGVLVVDGGPTCNPSTAEVLNELVSSQAARVILLPNASAVDGVAEMAAEEARAQGIEVAVIPTKSPVQGLAAVAVHDENRRFEDDVIALAEAAAATRFAEVTIAVRESITYVGRCQAGDVLGLIDGEVVEIGAEVAAVGISLAERLISAGAELVTVLAGSDPGGTEAAAVLASHVKAHHPLIELNAFAGGQPYFPLLIGAE